MDALERQIRRARRRLTFQRFLNVLGGCWTATLAAALLAIVVDKFRPLGPDAWVWAAGALGLGLIAAAARTLSTRGSLLDAAVEIDHRFELKERVSSALALSPADRQSAIGEALVADAAGRIERIDLSDRFGVRPPRRLLLPLAPAALAALAALLIAPAGNEKSAAAGVEDTAVKQQIRKSTETVRRQLADRRQQAKKEGLRDAEQLFKKLEDGAKDLKADSGREKAMVKLNDLSKMLTERRQQLGGAEKIKQQLDQLKNVERGPADKFSKALSRGDFQKAADELKKLQAELADNKLGEKQKAELAKQLDQMKEKLDKLADAHRAAERDMKQRAKQLRKPARRPRLTSLKSNSKSSSSRPRRCNNCRIWPRNSGSARSA